MANNLENFKKFIDHFKTEQKDLVEAVEHQKIIIPKPYQNPNKDIMLLSEKAANKNPLNIW